MSDLNNQFNPNRRTARPLEGSDKPSMFNKPSDPGLTVLMLESTERKSGYDKNGELWVQVSFINENDGKRFQEFLSTRAYSWKGAPNSSSFNDFLMANDITEGVETDEEYLDALNRIAGPFYASLTWQADCQDCDERVKGVKKFPKVNGVRSHITKCPSCKRAIGAKNVVSRYVPRHEVEGTELEMEAGA